MVFFVPRNIDQYTTGITTKDIEWFMTNAAERMKNVYFVFGAYETIDAHDNTRYLPVDAEEKISAMANIFSDFKRHMKDLMPERLELSKGDDVLIVEPNA